MPTRGPTSNRPLPTNTRAARYRPTTRLGLGGVAIGNGFAPATDEQTLATLEAAWKSGVRYFDTSPFYGYGLSERRFGAFLHGKKPDEYVVSTKVGRIFTASQKAPAPSQWKDPAWFEYRYDYSADAVRRSIEDSLQRLGVSRIDVVFVHDLAPSNRDFKKGEYEAHFAVAQKGAFAALTKLRDEKVIDAWGLGVNDPEPALKALEVADPDIFLLATQYSLDSHQRALEETFPAMEKRKVSVVVGAPLNAGWLAGRDRYNYDGKIPDGAKKKRERMTAIADQHGIDLRTAALQFCNAHPVVSAVIPGARTADQADANAKSFSVNVPEAFWAALKNEGLIAKEAPTPKS